MSNDEINMDEVRSALKRGRAAGAIGVCSVCGKSASRDHSAINTENSFHRKVKELGIAHKLKLVDNALLGNLDITKRREWAIQAELYRAQIQKAREEHDAYVPTTPTQSKSQNEISNVLRDCADLLGRSIPEAEDGVVLPPLVIAYKLKEILLNIVRR